MEVTCIKKKKRFSNLKHMITYLIMNFVYEVYEV